LDAENLLNNTSVGTFLIRPSDRKKHQVRLSVRCNSETRGIHTRHYYINEIKKKQVFLFKEEIFNSVPDLVQYYTSNMVLLNACVSYHFIVIIKFVLFEF